MTVRAGPYIRRGILDNMRWARECDAEADKHESRARRDRELAKEHRAKAESWAKDTDAIELLQADGASVKSERT